MSEKKGFMSRQHTRSLLFSLIKGEMGTDLGIFDSIANLTNILTLLFPIQLFDLKQKNNAKNMSAEKRAERNWHLLVFY